MTVVTEQYGLIVTFTTAIALRQLNGVLKTTAYTAPQSVVTNEYQFWKWRNISISLVHSFITAFWGLLAQSVIRCESSLRYDVLVFRDVCRKEIIVHHILTIGCCMIALVVEISNIFAHLRQLLFMRGLRKSTTYRFNSVITIISLIIMRLFPLSWIVFCLYMDNDSMGFMYWFLSTFSAVVIIIFSIAITIRVAHKDFIVTKRHES